MNTFIKHMRPIVMASLVAFSALGLSLSGTQVAASGVEIAKPTTLRSSISVDGTYVYLKDVFDGPVGRYADKPIAYAPKPGSRLVLEADWLLRVAQAYDVKWKPASIYERAVVLRPSQVVTHEQIMDRVRQALLTSGLPADSELYTGRGSQSVHIPAAARAEIAVLDAVYDAGGKTFSALIEVPAGSPEAQRVNVSGRVFDTLEVPVLIRSVSRGEIIDDRDVTWVRIRARELGRDALVDAGNVIGMEARRHLRAEKPLRAQDVMEPLMVRKGAMVKILLRQPFMSLTAEGKALENGSAGQEVRIMNLSSRQVIRATVMDMNLVAVGSLATLSAIEQTASR